LIITSMTQLSIKKELILLHSIHGSKNPLEVTFLKVETTKNLEKNW